MQETTFTRCILLLHLQEKGIRKRKRSKLVYDDEAKEWRRRHGYKRANDDSEVPVIEAKAGDKVRSSAADTEACLVGLCAWLVTCVYGCG